jgi:dipeptidyl aminopeptidase/acylaminoacyl peptidase
MDNWLRPILYNFAQKRIIEIRHDVFRGDVWVLRWDEDIEEMILCDVYQARQKLYRYNTRTQKITQIGPKIGGFNFHFNSAGRLGDGSLILKWHDFNTSPRLIRIRAPRYDKWNEITPWSGDVKSRYEVKSIWVSSSDGERVQMWVVRPRKTKKYLPFVIDIHGGPHGVTGDEFSPEAQIWLANGFGYCSVNYRGSIGFGKKFERKIYGNPGCWEVEDIVAARNWLIRKEYAEPNNIILYGWSWGGYVVLFALGKYPDLWRRGIAGAAIADCIMQYEDEPAYFKAWDQEIFRGTPKTARARYARSSPVTYVDRIQAPILLLHGKNDVRCPPRQIRYFVNKLKKLNKRISIEWFKSGHTGEFTDTSLRVKLMSKVLRFAAINKRTPLKNKKVS